MQSERRRSLRLYVTLPTAYTVLPGRDMEMPQELANVYERVMANSELADQSFQGMIRDLSANGAFVTGQTVPLLSRLRLKFPLPGMAQVEAIGWVLWHRKDDCTLKRANGEPVVLKAGFGVLFEAIPAEARRHINKLAHMNAAASVLLGG